ncbi:hypothetical protein [Streptomyces sp. NPDC002573]|uniref:hypothetical protein n=1 Tax=Streptomyces sp. NPDC002573 TaxID=3364651 RepID=UPI0036BECC78
MSKAFRRIADALADAGERGREDTGRHHAVVRRRRRVSLILSACPFFDRENTGHNAGE